MSTFLKNTYSLIHKAYKVNINEVIKNNEIMTYDSKTTKLDDSEKERFITMNYKRSSKLLEDEKLENVSIYNSLYESVSGCSITTYFGQSTNEYDKLKISNTVNTDFINNLVLKNSFYEDKLKEKYSGEELEQRLKSLNNMYDEVSDKLTDCVANDFEKFFSGDEDWVYCCAKDKLRDSDTINEYYKFDKEEFKKNISDIIKQQKDLLNDIKSKEPKKWKDVVNYAGYNIDYFKNKLVTATDLSTNKIDDKIENMSYKDIFAVENIISNLHNNFLDGLSKDVMIGANLGQYKLKSEFMLKNISLPKNIKDIVSDIVDKNVKNKIKNAGDYQRLLEVADTVEVKRLQKNMASEYNKFSELLKIAKENFANKYSSSINDLRNHINSINIYNNGYMDNQRIDDQVEDWNSFISNLKISNQDKKYYNINMYNGNVIDKKI